MSKLARAGYELWDTESRNLVGDFDTGADALVAARDLIVEHPSVYPAALALVQVSSDGKVAELAAGERLGRACGALLPAVPSLLPSEE